MPSEVKRWAESRAGTKKTFRLPVAHEPFMAGVKGGFSCANCSKHYVEGGKDLCGAPEYEDFMGTKQIVDPKTRKPVDDVATACSDWFEPKGRER